MWTHPRRRSTWRTTGVLAVLALACAPALAGCSGGTSVSGAPANAASSVTSSTSANGSSTGGGGAAGGGASADAASSVPLPSPTGTWTPAGRRAAKGPTAPAPVPTRSAALTSPVTFDSLVTVRLTGVQATTVKARTPGENSGPAVKVTVRVLNKSTAPVDVGSAVVSLKADKGVLGVGTTAGSPSPLHGRVAPGATATGSYVFMLTPAKARHVTVSVNYAAGEPVAVFTGRTA